jgi:hypothetical protein
MAVLPYKPKRRSLLRALTLAALGIPFVQLGRVLARRQKKRVEDLPPIPWIGHC